MGKREERLASPSYQHSGHLNPFFLIKSNSITKSGMPAVIRITCMQPLIIRVEENPIAHKLLNTLMELVLEPNEETPADGYLKATNLIYEN